VLVLVPRGSIGRVGALLRAWAGWSAATFLAGRQLALHMVRALGQFVGEAALVGSIVASSDQSSVDEVSPCLAGDAAIAPTAAEASSEQVAAGGGFLS